MELLHELSGRVGHAGGEAANSDGRYLTDEAHDHTEGERSLQQMCFCKISIFSKVFIISQTKGVSVGTEQETDGDAT